MALNVGTLTAYLTLDDKEFEKRLDGAKGTFGKLGGVLAGLGMAAGVAAGAALAAGIVQAVNVDEANKKLSAQLGLNQAESAKLGKAAGAVYSNAYGESMEDVNDAIKSVMQNVPGMADASVQELQTTTQRSLDIASAFGSDAAEVTRTAGQLVANGMAANATEAMDQVTAALQGGGNKAEDFFDTFNEYGSTFAGLGLDGATAMGLMNQALAAGVPNTDFAADSLRQFRTMALDTSSDAGASFSALGLNADAMRDAIAKGGPAAQDALGQTLDALREVKDPAEQAQLGVGLLGSQWEDLGTALLGMDVDTAADKLGKVDGAADAMGATLNDTVGSRLEGFKRKIMGFVTGPLLDSVVPAIHSALDAAERFGQGFGASSAEGLSGFSAAGFYVKEAALGIRDGVQGAWDVLSGIVGFVREHSTVFTVLAGAIGGAALAFKAAQLAQTAYTLVTTGVPGIVGAAKVAVIAFNAALRANPIGLIVTAIGLLVGAFIGLMASNEGFRNAVLGVWDSIKGAVGAVVGWLTDSALPGIKTAFEAVGSAFSWVWSNVLEPVFDGVGSAAGWLWNSVLVPAFDGISTAFRAVGDAVSWVWSNAIKPAWDAVASAAGWLWKNVLVPAFDGIKTSWSNAVSGVKWYWDNILKPAFDAVGSAAGWLWKNVLSPAFDGIKQSWANAVSGVRWVYDNVLKPAFDAVSNAVGGVKGVFERSVDAIGKAWDGLKDKAKNPIKFIVNDVLNHGLIDAFNWVAGKVGVAKKDQLDYFNLPQGFATGGAIRGAGTGTSDSIPAMLSNGEHVWTAKEVQAAGGHAGVMAMRQGVLHGMDVGHYATGGPIGRVPGTGDLWDRVKSTATDALGAITDPIGTIRKVVDGLVGGAGDSALAGIAKAIPTKLIDTIKDKASGLFSGAAGGAGGPLGGGGGVGGYQWQMAVLRAAFPGLSMNSGFRPGAITATGNVSYHSKGRAVDVPPRRDVFDWIRQNYGANTKELIFSPAGQAQLHNGKPHVYSGVTKDMHYDHVHWAFDQGGIADGMGYLPKATIKPERVLSPQQTESFDRLVDHLTNGSGTTGREFHYHAAEGRSMPEEDFYRAVNSPRLLAAGW